MMAPCMPGRRIVGFLGDRLRLREARAGGMRKPGEDTHGEPGFDAGEGVANPRHVGHLSRDGSPRTATPRRCLSDVRGARRFEASGCPEVVADQEVNVFLGIFDAVRECLGRDDFFLGFAGAATISTALPTSRRGSSPGGVSRPRSRA